MSLVCRGLDLGRLPPLVSPASLVDGDGPGLDFDLEQFGAEDWGVGGVPGKIFNYPMYWLLQKRPLDGGLGSSPRLPALDMLRSGLHARIHVIRHVSIQLIPMRLPQ